MTTNDFNYKDYLHEILMLHKEDISQKTLKELFGHVDDDFWFWVHTEGYRNEPIIHNLLPGFPDETLQANVTGSSGDQTLNEAHSAYKYFKSIAKSQGKEVGSCEKILDFGCGWGRFLRFFLKDIDESLLYGADCDRDLIEVCKASKLKCNLEATDPYPPTYFTENVFDMIYSYSVFSHLSEDIHKKWLGEIRRILKPGGIFIATTRPRNFIENVAEIRKRTELPDNLRGAAASFINVEQSLIDYDNGKFCHSATGGGGIREKSFYGETCIPKEYARNEWTNFFRFVNFIDYKEHKSFDQNVIIGVK
jgi:SAM-dependent methyltransferase